MGIFSCETVQQNNFKNVVKLSNLNYIEILHVEFLALLSLHLNTMKCNDDPD